MKKISPRALAKLKEHGVDLENLQCLRSTSESRQVSANEIKIGKEELWPGRTPTAGVDPQSVIQYTLAQMRHTEVRSFIGTVFAEPEIRQLLISRFSATTPPSRNPRYGIEFLRSAANHASYWCVLGRDERDALYAATLLAGLKALLLQGIVGGASADDVLLTIVRSALHRLDDDAPHQAMVLRLCLGWGNADEIDQHYVPQLQHAVRRALEVASQGVLPAGTPTPPGKPAVKAKTQVASPEAAAKRVSKKR